ncbi:hypothetical protein PAPHI01_1509 [Pancytospora philotis]|nr:hypothetical protein PAPHI01_1509 [Pancytospora philotis]
MENARLEELITAYVNEKSARRLLPYSRAADIFSALIKSYRANPSEPQALRTLREVEAERIKYFVKEYLLARLDKLQRNIFLDRGLMSRGEAAFYEKWLALLAREDVLTEKRSKEIEYVGFYCVNSLNNVMIDGEVIEIFEGDFFVASIDDIMEYVKRGDVVLI